LSDNKRDEETGDMIKADIITFHKINKKNPLIMITNVG